MIAYIPHLITLLLYIFVILFAVRNFFNVKNAHKNNLLRFSIKAYVIMTVYACSLFIYNQSNWVLNSHGELVGGAANMLWVHGDHVVAITWLVSQSLLHIYLNFKSECENHLKCPRRRATDD